MPALVRPNSLDNFETVVGLSSGWHSLAA